MTHKIILENASVCYENLNYKTHSIKDYFVKKIKDQINSEYFWALSDISIKIKTGDILGIIGKNGAGKSTLLKLISRVLTPTKGRIIVKGEVSPLLELGAGFHPDLTGYENIFLNSTLLSHSKKEVAAKIEDIINFSEINDFIGSPLSTYSSGMVARLGFAIATAWKPDILLIDEVLSVGDFAFQNKCVKKITSFNKSGSATILFVSHNMDLVRKMCNKVLWLEDGKIKILGDPSNTINAYMNYGKTKNA